MWKGGLEDRVKGLEGELSIVVVGYSWGFIEYMVLMRVGVYIWVDK